MAALRGTLQGNRGTVSRLGSKNSGIESVLNTWDGEIITFLKADGRFRVTILPKNGHLPYTLKGNVNDGNIEV